MGPAVCGCAAPVPAAHQTGLDRRLLGRRSPARLSWPRLHGWRVGRVRDGGGSAARHGAAGQCSRGGCRGGGHGGCRGAGRVGRRCGGGGRGRRGRVGRPTAGAGHLHKVHAGGGGGLLADKRALCGGRLLPARGVQGKDGQAEARRQARQQGLDGPRALGRDICEGAGRIGETCGRSLRAPLSLKGDDDEQQGRDCVFRRK
mmetsp:Transcript_1785/g.5799  ORF Transcript_1785/g.5799 Transcript_1785/m.5799 type:complete len:202 (+) Transcript_1785:611-1216(+)